jgi:adenylate kinase family enzyme
MAHKALLLIGPTGAGKTPLGEYLQRHAFWDIPCIHFDFGQQLREVATRPPRDNLLTAADIRIVQTALATGALLEDNQFYIAGAILRGFIADHRVPDGTWVVLNGLPRHVGQAHDIQTIVSVEIVVQLACSAETILERIRTNAGSDRTGRSDDDLPAVKRRLETFQARTEPLLQHYRVTGVPIETVRVGPRTTPEDMCRQLLRTC